MFSRKTTAGDICTRIVSIAPPGLSLEEAARVMRDQQVGCLVIVEEPSPEDRQVVGALTDRDIVTQVVAGQKNPNGLCAADVMSREVASVREDDSLLDVLATMRRKAVRRVPVVGPHDRLIGVISIDDVLEVLAEEMQAVADAIGAAQHHEQRQGR